ncbi:lipoprotein [Aquipluma nitroreducens]|uniref:Lipoprotein n=1 Tax=Aquipluma nitroreducens TaxID=2010828 RepID=A0A5K7S5P5_9BACT|nr:DUF4382 domain-containing protein [Aquipluma nitroreducens]BBE16849.1 lipoprotein [Aquipluma nitroreducens]
MKNLLKNGLMLLTGILMLATSCNQISDSESGGNGKIVLSLTDAPFPVSLVDKALVTIDKIEIRSTATVSSTTEVTTNSELFTVLYDGDPMEFDLLDLQNGITTELLSMDIAAGSYDLIRMHVTNASVLLKDGSNFDLKVPSGFASGLKIKMTPNLVIESGVESEVILDFDVSKSFVVQGNMKAKNGIKGFIFKPVLRATCQKYSGSVGGKVFENATTPIAEAHVQIIAADTILSSALTDAAGNYHMIGLPTGSYKVVCEKDGYTPVTVDPVVVKAREKTTLDIQMATATVTVNP